MGAKDVLKTALFTAGYFCGQKDRSMILYYHDFHMNNPVTPFSTSITLFLKHLKVIREAGYVVVDRITEPKGQVAIMLDDGHSGVFECQEVLEQENVRPTIFLATNLIDQVGKLKRSEIKHLSLKGFIFQSHGVSHRILNTLDENEIQTELGDSKSILEDILETEVDGFCAPNGFFSRKACEIAIELGYREFYSTVPGYFEDRITEFDFVRTRNCAQSLSPYNLKMTLGGGYRLLQNRVLSLRYNVDLSGNRM